jgi:hypothetical protein
MKKKSILSHVESNQGEKTPCVRIWIVIFILTMLLSLALQLLILPYLFPELDNGEGLIVDTDSCLYHQVAVNQSNMIFERGWKYYTLKPENQVMGGIATIFYTVISPHPWSLIPLNSALYAFSVVLLTLIVDRFFNNWLLSTVSVLPFWLFPTATLLYAQINKDALFVPGVLCLLFSWVIVFESQKHSRTIAAQISIFLLLNTIGLFLSCVVRPYFFEIYMVLYLIIGIFILMLKMYARFKEGKTGDNYLYFTIIITYVILSFIPIESTKISSFHKISSFQNKKDDWNWNERIPDFIEYQIIGLIKARNGFYSSYNHAGSNFDEDVHIDNIVTFTRYIPRAVIMAFLSPFPNFWIKEAKSEGGGVMRFVCAIEMSIVYLMLIFLPVSIYFWRQKPILWIVFIFCFFLITVFTIAIPNLGALYRIRYSFLMPFVVIGFSGVIKLATKSCVKTLPTY